MHIRIAHHAETLDHLISGLETGSRTITPLETAQLLKTLSQALESCLVGQELTNPQRNIDICSGVSENVGIDPILLGKL